MPQACSALVAGAFTAQSTNSLIDFRILTPTDVEAGERLPLLLHLHGALSTAEQSLAAAKPTYDAAWENGTLPRAIVACATTPTVGGFYIDQPNGPRYETLVGREFPEEVAARYNAGPARAVIGSSMGGYGALKLAFRAPEQYVAVAALAPAIFPGETPMSVPARNLPAVLGELHRTMGADDVSYRHNSVYGIARMHRDRIQAAGVGVYFDCGDADEFGLHDGATFLDHLLTECAIAHEFHSLAGVGHAGGVSLRLAHAIEFVGRRLTAS